MSVEQLIHPGYAYFATVSTHTGFLLFLRTGLLAASTPSLHSHSASLVFLLAVFQLFLRPPRRLSAARGGGGGGVGGGVWLGTMANGVRGRPGLCTFLLVLVPEAFSLSPPVGSEGVAMV